MLGISQGFKIFIRNLKREIFMYIHDNRIHDNRNVIFRSFFRFILGKKLKQTPAMLPLPVLCGVSSGPFDFLHQLQITRSDTQKHGIRAFNKHERNQNGWIRLFG